MQRLPCEKHWGDRAIKMRPQMYRVSFLQSGLADQGILIFIIIIIIMPRLPCETHLGAMQCDSIYREDRTYDTRCPYCTCPFINVNVCSYCALFRPKVNNNDFDLRQNEDIQYAVAVHFALVQGKEIPPKPPKNIHCEVVRRVNPDANFRP